MIIDIMNPIGAWLTVFWGLMFVIGFASDFLYPYVKTAELSNFVDRFIAPVYITIIMFYAVIYLVAFIFSKFFGGT